MSSWEFFNVGFICEKEDVENVKKLLECIGIDFDDVNESQDGEINEMFWNVVDKGCDNSDFQPEEIYTIVNKVFKNTIILYEGEEGNSISDWYSRFEKIFDSKKKKILCGKYDYCIGEGEEKKVSKWKEDIKDVEIERESILNIIKAAEQKGYTDLVNKLNEVFQ